MYFKATLPNRCLFTDKFIQAGSAPLVLPHALRWRRGEEITLLVCFTVALLCAFLDGFHTYLN